MNLYEIDNAILETIDFETGEVIDPERLDALQMEREKKLEGVALWIKNLESSVEAYKAEMESFMVRRKAAERKIESLKGWLANALQGEKFSTAKCAVGFRKSQAVEITDEAAIRAFAPGSYPDLLTIQMPTINKIEVKKALKDGWEIPGAALVERQNIQIK